MFDHDADRRRGAGLRLDGAVVGKADAEAPSAVKHLFADIIDRAYEMLRTLAPDDVRATVTQADMDRLTAEYLSRQASIVLTSPTAFSDYLQAMYGTPEKPAESVIAPGWGIVEISWEDAQKRVRMRDRPDPRGMYGERPITSDAEPAAPVPPQTGGHNGL